MQPGIGENPRESLNWRRHRAGCPHYRVRWFVESDPEAGEPLYQVFCGQGTPPETFEEQERCVASKFHCWRLAQAKRGDTAERPPLAESGRRPA